VDAAKLAGIVASNAPLGVAASKEILYAQQDWPMDEAFDRQTALGSAAEGVGGRTRGRQVIRGKTPSIRRG
jgi:hypothetical protein